MIHSPQAAKLPIVIVSAVVDIVAGVLGFLLAETVLGGLLGAAVAVITLVLAYYVASGC